MLVKPGICGEMYRTNRQLWKDHLGAHKAKMQRMSSGSERWAYICSHEVNSSHCEPLERWCRQLGLELVKDKLDWTEWRNSFENIGKPTIPEPPELQELVVVDEERQAIQAEPRFKDGARSPF